MILEMMGLAMTPAHFAGNLSLAPFLQNCIHLIAEGNDFKALEV
jgi:hypothetical protein